MAKAYPAPKSRARAAGTLGAQVRVKLAKAGQPAPMDQDALPVLIMTTPPTLGTEFRAKGGGITAVHMLRRVNTRGEMGRSSDIASAPVAARPISGIRQAAKRDCPKGSRMKTHLNTARPLVEIVVAIAIAEAVVMFILPLIAPGLEGAAEAILDARKRIVDGAVGMVQMALEQLQAHAVVQLDEERKAQMVSNLLVVLCSERGTQPVVNAGTLHG
jgi:hypothetical protein